MSATIDANKFAKYFATPVMGHLVPAPVISIGGKNIYNTQIFYLEQIAPIFGKGKPLPICEDNEPRLKPEMTDMVVEIVKKFDALDTEDGLKRWVILFMLKSS